MSRTEKKGLFATVLLLLGLFFFGYYGQDHQSDNASELSKLEDSQLLINKDPPVGLSIIDKIFKSVDLPEPDGPIRE